MCGKSEGGSGQVTDFMFIVQIPKTQAAFFKNTEVLLNDSLNSDFFFVFGLFLVASKEEWGLVVKVWKHFK